MSFTLTKKITSSLLLAAALLIYSNTLHHEFVWDDHYVIEQNAHMDSAQSLKSFFTKDFWQNSSIEFKSGFYRPITLSAFYLIHHLGGRQPFYFHLTNVILHGVCAIIIFLLFERILTNSIVSFLTAFLFIIHPVQTEVVAYIADLGDILVVLFLGVSFLFYCKYTDGRKKIHLWGSLGAFLLALLSKENAMTGVALIALIDWYFISKFNYRKFLSNVRIIMIYVALTGAYIALRILILGKLNALTTLDHVRYVSLLPSFDLLSHVLTTSKIVILYIKLLLVPGELSISYIMLPAVSLFSLDVFFGVLLLLILGLLIVFCLQPNFRWLSFGLLWFFITLTPITNLIPISNTIAERFLYLPGIGYYFILSYSFTVILKQKGAQRAWLIFLNLALMIFIVSLTLRTIERNRVWRDDYTLFSSALNMRPCAALPHLNLSTYFKLQGRGAQSDYHNQEYLRCLKYTQQEYLRLKGLLRPRTKGSPKINP